MIRREKLLALLVISFGDTKPHPPPPLTPHTLSLSLCLYIYTIREIYNNYYYYYYLGLKVTNSVVRN